MARERRWCGTSAKTRYPGAASAETQLRHLAMHARGPGTPTSAYRCPYCDGWHLTSWDPDRPAATAAGGSGRTPRRQRPVGATVRIRER